MIARNKGFSLIEIMVGLGVMAIVSLGLLEMNRGQQKSIKNANQANDISNTHRLLAQLIQDEQDCYSTFKNISFSTIKQTNQINVSLKRLDPQFALMKSPLKATSNDPIICGDRNRVDPQQCWAIVPGDQHKIKFDTSTEYECQVQEDCSSATGLACYILNSNTSCRVNAPQENSIVKIGKQFQNQLKLNDLQMQFSSLAGNELDAQLSLVFDKSSSFLGSQASNKMVPIRFKLDANDQLISCGLGAGYLNDSEVCSLMDEEYDSVLNKCVTSAKNELKYRKMMCKNSGGRLVQDSATLNSIGDFNSKDTLNDCELTNEGKMPARCYCLDTLHEYRMYVYKKNQQPKPINMVKWGCYTPMVGGSCPGSDWNATYWPENFEDGHVPLENVQKGIFKLAPFSTSRLKLLGPNASEPGIRFYHAQANICVGNVAKFPIKMKQYQFCYQPADNSPLKCFHNGADLVGASRGADINNTNSAYSVYGEIGSGPRVIIGEENKGTDQEVEGFGSCFPIEAYFSSRATSGPIVALEVNFTAVDDSLDPGDSNNSTGNVVIRQIGISTDVFLDSARMPSYQFGGSETAVGKYRYSQ